MSSALPIQCEWDGEVFRPTGKRWAKEADKYYTIGERYMIAEYHQRSQISHSHFFVCVENAWANLPETIAQNFPSADHLRRWALIKAGFCNSQAFVASSKAEALRLLEFIKPIDSFAVVLVNECSVMYYTALSQSYRAMGKEEFQRSKDEVLRVIAELIGTDAKSLERSEAGARARDYGYEDEVMTLTIDKIVNAVTKPICQSFMTGLDDGPWLPGHAPRKKLRPKNADQLRAIRMKAWATRYRNFGPKGHR